MLQDRRRKRFARVIIGSMGDSPSPADHGPKEYYDTEHKSEEEPEEKSEGEPCAFEMAIGTMLTAIRENDTGLLARSFKAAFKACEMQEGE